MSGVFIMPGMIALARMPSFAYCSAMPTVNWFSAGLAGVVRDVGVAGVAHRRDRRDVDDGALPLPQHHRQYVLAGQEGAGDVDVQSPLPASSISSIGPPMSVMPTLLCRMSIRP